MPLVFIRHLGSNMAYIAPLEGPVDPGWGGGPPDHIWGGVGGRPDMPGQGLPGGGGRPDNSLPGAPGHPDNRPPGHPPVVLPGQTLVLVRDPVGVWHYATIDASTPPPKPVPVPPPTYPTTGPVPQPPGGVAGQPLPPTAAPKT